MKGFTVGLAASYVPHVMYATVRLDEFGTCRLVGVLDNSRGVGAGPV